MPHAVTTGWKQREAELRRHMLWQQGENRGRQSWDATCCDNRVKTGRQSWDATCCDNRVKTEGGRAEMPRAVTTGWKQREAELRCHVLWQQGENRERQSWDAMCCDNRVKTEGGRVEMPRAVTTGWKQREAELRCHVLWQQGENRGRQSWDATCCYDNRVNHHTKLDCKRFSGSEGIFWKKPDM